MNLTPLQSSWSKDRTLLKLECNLSLGWRDSGRKGQYNWYGKEKLLGLPPAWNSRGGKIEVWVIDFDEPWADIERALLGPMSFAGSDLIKRMEFAKKGDYLRMHLAFLVASPDGAKVSGWKVTTSTAVAKEKLEVFANIMPATITGGVANARLVIDPPDLKPGPIGRQGTGARHIVGGGLPS